MTDRRRRDLLAQCFYLGSKVQNNLWILRRALNDWFPYGSWGLILHSISSNKIKEDPKVLKEEKNLRHDNLDKKEWSTPRKHTTLHFLVELNYARPAEFPRGKTKTGGSGSFPAGDGRRLSETTGKHDLWSSIARRLAHGTKSMSCPKTGIRSEQQQGQSKSIIRSVVCDGR